MEKFGQIIFSINGHPEKASNQKKEIFDKYNNSIFNEKSFDISQANEFVKRYYEIKQTYERNNNNYESTEQKIFYILYLDKIFNNNTEEEIKFLEATLKKYNTVSNIPDARKLISLKFKSYLDSESNNITINNSDLFS